MPHTQMFHTRSAIAIMAILLASTVAQAQSPEPLNDAAQGPPPPAQGPGGGPQGGVRGGPGGGPGRQQGPQGLHMPPGMWWTNPDVVQKINLTTEQQKKIADTFQQYRLKLIDADAALHKEEAIMDPLVQTDTPEDAKILAQIDKVAQARAELEKTNARMLLGIRHVLTPEQWKTLQSEHPHGGPPPRGGPDGGGPPRRPQQE